MRIRSILFIALIISIGFFFYSTHHYSEKAAGNSSSNSIRKSTLQLFPMPTLVSDTENNQNTIIYDLLISKSSEIVFLYDTSVDMGVWGKYSPFDAKNLIIELKYNFNKDRLDFSGSDLVGRKVQGYCVLTDRNNLKYSIKIIDPHYALTLETIHNPNTENIDQPIFGAFTLESSIGEVFKEMGISSLKFGGEKFHLKGSYKSIKDKMEISNLILHGAVLDTKILIDNSSATSLSPAIEIVSSHKTMDFDNLFNGYDFSRKDLITWNDIMTQVAKFNIKFSTNIKEAEYEGEVLKDIAIDLESKKSNEINIRNISFKHNKDSHFNTSGVISNEYFYPRYDGKFDAKNIPYKVFAKILDLKEEVSSNPISSSANITVTPSTFSMRDLKLREGKGDMESSNFRYVSLNNSNDIVIGDIVANQDVSYFKLVSSFAKKYGDRLSQYGDRGTLGLGISIQKDAKNKKGMSFRYSNIPDTVSLRDVKYLNGAIQGDIKVEPQAGVFNSMFEGRDIKFADFHTLLEEVLYLRNATSLNNNVNSIDKFEFENLEGRNRIEIHNDNSQTFQEAQCDTRFEKNQMTFKSCKAKVFGKGMTFSGKIGGSKGVLSYNVSFQGNNVPLSEVWSKSNLRNKEFQGAEGLCDVQGYVKSIGKTSASLNRNIAGSIAVRCKNAKLFRSGADTEKNQEVNVIRGSFDIRKGKILSNNISYKDGEEEGNIKLHYNFDSATEELILVPNKIP